MNKVNTNKVLLNHLTWLDETIEKYREKKAQDDFEHDLFNTIANTLEMSQKALYKALRNG